MPTASPELRAEWPGGDQEAMQHLKMRGYILMRDWHWKAPPKSSGPSAQDQSAIRYLIDEWDFGGIAPHVS